MNIEKMGGDMQSPLVSICCITYNQEPYIRDALEGFLVQRTSFPYEVLIHDDASTDGTADIIRAYANEYPAVIKPILQSENQYSQGITNVSGLFNFPRAVGKYIAMCEGDDYWTDRDKLQAQVEYMEAHPDCALCFHSAKIELVERAVTERRMRPYRRSRVVAPEELIGKKSGYPTASLLFRTEMVKALPDFYNHAPLADIPLQLLAAARGYGYYMDRDMCVYRLGGAVSWTKMMKQGNYEEKQRQYFLQMERMYQGFDQYSDGRFHGAVEMAARRIYFLTQVNTKHYEIVFAKENRRFFKELNARARFFIGMEYRLPWLYRCLERIARQVAGGKHRR